MNPDGTADTFGVAFRGDDAGNIWRDDVLLFAADVAGMRDVHLGIVRRGDRAISDLLKLSGCRRLRVWVDVLDATGCTEDAIDINHSHDCEVLVNDLHPALKYCATVKGGSTNIRLVVGRQHGHGGEIDYDLGNFADQSNARTTGVRLHVNTVDHSPVRVRVLTADRPVLENAGPNYVYPQTYVVDARAQGWFYPVYNFLKDLLKTFGVNI